MRVNVPRCVAKVILQFDAEIAEKGHLWMEDSSPCSRWADNQEGEMGVVLPAYSMQGEMNGKNSNLRTCQTA